MTSFRTHISTISFLSPLPLILSTLHGYGFSASIFLTALVLILIPRSKLHQSQQTPITETALVQQTLDFEGILQQYSKEQEQSSLIEEEEEEEVVEEEEEEEEEEARRRRELTDGECKGRLSSTSEESEVDYWPFQGNMFQSPDFMDGGYISDEESLIEIALPGGEFVIRSSCKDHKRQFAVIEEDDNLFEIDISMGSNKSRFEIES